MNQEEINTQFIKLANKWKKQVGVDNEQAILALVNCFLCAIASTGIAPDGFKFLCDEMHKSYEGFIDEFYKKIEKLAKTDSQK